VQQLDELANHISSRNQIYIEGATRNNGYLKLCIWVSKKLVKDFKQLLLYVT